MRLLAKGCTIASVANSIDRIEYLEKPVNCCRRAAFVLGVTLAAVKMAEEQWNVSMYSGAAP